MPGNASGQATLLAVWRNWPLSDEEIFMRLDATAQGVYPIAPTPFHPNGRIDEVSIDPLSKAYVSSGVPGVTVLGIMGERAKIGPGEALNIAAPLLRHAQARRLAGARKNLGIARLSSRRLHAPHFNSYREWRLVSRFRNGARRGRRHDRLCFS